MKERLLLFMISRQIHSIFKSRGVSQCGFCPFSDVLPLLDVCSRSRIPENAKTVIFALFPYYIGPLPHRNLSRYAVPDDYHNIAGQILHSCCQALSDCFPAEQFVSFVDSSPIREVYGAYLSGLGWMGKNGMLINPVFGSYVFIGEIVTTLPVPCSPQPLGGCLGCGLCLQQCPTGALKAAGLTESLCRSAITQKKGELSSWESEQVQKGRLAWGCDICNDVCPMNQHTLPSNLPQFYENFDSRVTMENLPALRKRKAFCYRSRSVMERNLKLTEYLS